MERKITKIEPTKNQITGAPKTQIAKRKVAAYARVSTDQEEQLTSYEAQVDYYTNYINRRPDWEFVGVYADEGISGTNTKRRDGFNKMINDALDGKIDLIITKSISRFARNTVDSLVNIRKLKEHNVECYFEKENINTFDSKGELLITIMSSLAQEESRSISENVTWGQRKRFADGKVSIPFASFLGYKKGPNGEIAIDEEEAKVVKRIYFDFMSGKSAENIARELTRDGIKTPAGKDKWGKASVLAILSNEKYKGDALLQKTFVVNFLDHKKKKNEGEIPQYYVKNSHPWIISEEEWELVQIELRRRKELKYSYSYKNPFCAKLVCEDCGSSYGKKIWHSTTNRKEVFQCNNKFKHHCKTPHLMEDDVKRRFLIAYNRMYSNKEEILMNLENVKTLLTDTSKLEAKINSTKETLEEYTKEFRLLIDANTKTIQDQDIWKKKYAELEEKYKNKEEEYNKLITEKDIKIAKSKEIEAFIEQFKKSKYIQEWDERIFNFTLEKAVVHKDKSITFIFLSGVEIKVEAGE